MIATLWFLAGAASTAVVATAVSRRQAQRARDLLDEAQRQRQRAAREAAELRERRTRAVATIQTVVQDLRHRVETARTDVSRAEERALAATQAAAAEAEAAAAARRTAAALQAQAEAEQREASTPRAACPVEPAAMPLAQALSHEIANIVSAIEGGTFRLIEAVPILRTRPDAIESLWLAVRRLRRFHDKMRAFVHAPEPEPGTTPIESLLAGLRDELDATELGLQMAWNLPRTPPTLRGAADELLGALVFVSMALQQLERGALRLSIHVEPCFEGAEPQTQLELDLERDETPGRTPTAGAPQPAFLVARAAARNVLARLGGSVTITHEPGLSARALVRLPVVNPDALPTAPADLPPATDVPLPIGRSHRYGGALLIESDPTIRSMLASELRATGRAVFACADGAAARSLMQATPDRFEMLIVDHAARLDSGDMLAATAERLCPTLKVFVLSDFADQQLPPDLAARVTRIRKPFGVQELRRALAAAFAE